MKAETVRPDLQPVDPSSGQALPPRPQPGYYPGFKTLSQQSFWDSTTRELILDRVQNVPPIRFFTSDQAELLQVVCDRILPQDDRKESRRIPIVPIIDARLAEGKGDGYRFEGMPPDPEAHRPTPSPESFPRWPATTSTALHPAKEVPIEIPSSRSFPDPYQRDLYEWELAHAWSHAALTSADAPILSGG